MVPECFHSSCRSIIFWVAVFHSDIERYSPAAIAAAFPQISSLTFRLSSCSCFRDSKKWWYFSLIWLVAALKRSQSGSFCSLGIGPISFQRECSSCNCLKAPAISLFSTNFSASSQRAFFASRFRFRSRSRNSLLILI